MKKIAVLLSVLLLLSALFVPGAFAERLFEKDEEIIPEPVYGVNPDGTLADAAINCEAACVMDADTGEILFAKEADTKMFPASITKVMTCLLTIEYAEKLDMGYDEVVTVEHTYSLEKGAVEIYMRKGEQFTLNQLLHALMLKSANDVAVLLAEHIGGSVEGFAEMMNRRAAELGMTSTHFVTPNGLHDDAHYLTAHDMALLMQEAIRHDKFRELTATMKYTIPATVQYDEPRYLSQSNRLLKKDDRYYYEYCLGGKTGYTSKARNTFVCFGEKDGRTVIAVVLHSPLTETRFASARNLLKYGLENFCTVDVAQVLASDMLNVPVTGAQEDPTQMTELPVRQVPRSTGTVTVNLTTESAQVDASAYMHEIIWNENLAAPIAAGTVLGEATYWSAQTGETVLFCDLVADQDLLAWNQTELVETAPEDGESQKASVPVVTPRDEDNGSSLTKWIAVALIILILLIVVVILMLIRSVKAAAKKAQATAVGGRTGRNHYAHTAVRSEGSYRAGRRRR